MENNNLLKYIELSDLWDKYASDKTKLELSNEVNSTIIQLPVEGTNEVSYHKVGYFGCTIHWPFDQELAIDLYAERMMKLVNWAVEEGLFIHGCLVKLAQMDLIGLNRTGDYVDSDGYLLERQTFNRKRKCRGRYTKRCMILIYPICTIDREEFNSRAKEELGWGYAYYQEGELPHQLELQKDK